MSMFNIHNQLDIKKSISPPFLQQMACQVPCSGPRGEASKTQKEIVSELYSKIITECQRRQSWQRIPNSSPRTHYYVYSYGTESAQVCKLCRVGKCFPRKLWVFFVYLPSRRRRRGRRRRRPVLSFLHFCVMSQWFWGEFIAARPETSSPTVYIWFRWIQ